MKLSTKNKKPSPTNQNYYSDSARNPNSSLKGSRCQPFVLYRFVKGTSLFTAVSRKVNAGMTVEASIVLPLFLFFFLNLGCAIEMIRLHGNLQLALWQIGNRLSVYGYAVDSGEMPEGEKQEGGWWNDLTGIAFTSTVVKNQVIKSAGKSYLEQSPLTKGADGLQFWESRIFGEEDEISIAVTYSVSPWISLMGFGDFRMANRYYSHIWNGYRLPGEGTGGKPEQQEMVYITETGSVYHLRQSCSYLMLSIKTVQGTIIGAQRNKYGAKYYPCEKCAGGDGNKPILFYITDDGTCYHFDRNCSGLKRTISSIPLDQAIEAGYHSCSRCGGK